MPVTRLPDVSEGDRLALEDIIARRALRAVYQPVVELDSGLTIGWEALIRGPAGSALEFPDRLFSIAARLGLTAELDYCCRAVAVSGALDAGLGRRQELLVNIEPNAASAQIPAFLIAVRELVQQHLRVTVELTERALTARPAELLALVEEYRDRGWGIALDDVGLDPRSVSLMPLLRPDLIKLDMSFVQQPLTREKARVLHAVIAEAERSGAIVLAEGIENEQHMETACGLGATLGQGWLFGHPGPLLPAATALPPRVPHASQRAAAAKSVNDTPFEALAVSGVPRRSAGLHLLQPMSYALEAEALEQGPSALLISTFQDASQFDRSIAKRYSQIAKRAAFVGALARGLERTPSVGVHGAALGEAESLRREWTVVVLGPHFAGALVARELDSDANGASRQFEYVLTFDRDNVVLAAARLMARIAPFIDDPTD